MLKYLNNLFGPQPYELSLINSKNTKVIKLLKTTNIIRFFVFPIALLLLILGFISECILFVFDLISHSCRFLFEVINDSLWIDISWFGITEEEMHEEIQNGNNKKS